TSLDVLPVEARLFVKRPLAKVTDETKEYYDLLYASYNRQVPTDLSLYESVDVSTIPLIDLGNSVDRSLWIAILGRTDDRDASPAEPWKTLKEKLANRTLSLGIIPENGFDGMTIGPAKQSAKASSVLQYHMPQVVTPIPRVAEQPAPGYRQLTPRADFDPLTQAGIVELTLPSAGAIDTWHDLEPLEAGVGDLPPSIDDAKIADRIVTWLRISASSASQVRLNWVGINAAQIRQIIHVGAEKLTDGDGTPNQTRKLGKQPVLEGSVSVSSFVGDTPQIWTQIDDILAADPEVPVYPAKLGPSPLVRVFTVDHEAGIISFGDGLTGQRPRGAEMLYASYDYSEGIEGNVAAGSIQAGPLITAGVTATNPVATWGGADAETIAQGEKQVPRVIQHRERLVTADDFRTIAWRTPGITIGRIEVLPACHPDMTPVAVGTAPGVVTLMAIPKNDPLHPDAPRSDSRFINALCRYLDPRRLVTTEIVLRGADYVGVWLSLGIEIEASFQSAEVIDAVQARLKAFLCPLPPKEIHLPELLGPLYAPESDPTLGGWPLAKPVNARTLLAEAARVHGVVSVAPVLLARGDGPAVDFVAITGLELPEILGISVTTGDPVPIDSVRGSSAPVAITGGKPRLPVPVVAETC
ncbi:MAG: hypothetical protein RL367_1513, partial [Pseudomonadota bacterium]